MVSEQVRVSLFGLGVSAQHVPAPFPLFLSCTSSVHFDLLPGDVVMKGNMRWATSKHS